jgi:hypothetical protein
MGAQQPTVMESVFAAKLIGRDDILTVASRHRKTQGQHWGKGSFDGDTHKLWEHDGRQ